MFHFLHIFLLLFTWVQPGSLPICEQYRDNLDFCKKQNEKCVKERPGYLSCNKNYKNCLLELKDHEDCKHITSNILNPERNEIITEDIIMDRLEIRILKWLHSRLLELDKNCYKGTEYNDKLREVTEQMTLNYTRNKIAPILVRNDLIYSSNKSVPCDKSVKNLQKAIIEMDGKMFFQMRISSDYWHCGSTHGYFVSIILRATAIIAMDPNEILKFNHNCAIHRNCYLGKENEAECDEAFKKSNQGIVDEVKNGKSGAREFKKILEETHLLKSDLAYANLNSTEYEYQTFSFELGTSNIPNEFRNTVYLLEPATDYGIENFEKGIYNLYKNCRNNRVTISSLMYGFVHCMDSGDPNCREQLNDGTHKLESVDGECSNAIDQLKSDLGLTFLKKMKKFFSEPSYLSFLVEIFVSWVLPCLYLFRLLIWLCRRFRHWRNSRNNAVTAEQNVPNSLIRNEDL